jgi:hypothetical protein
MEKNVYHPSVSAQDGCETFLQENKVYAGNDHHDEGVGHIQCVMAQSGSLMNQNYISNG